MYVESYNKWLKWLNNAVRKSVKKENNEKIIKVIEKRFFLFCILFDEL